MSRLGQGKKDAAKPTKRDAPLLLLAELLAPGHAKTKARVALALSNPDAYRKKFAEDLEDRNVEDDPIDPFLALVSALGDDSVDLAWGVDWKESADEIQGRIAAVIVAQRKLRKSAAFDAKRAFAFYDEDLYLMTKTDPFITLCGRALSAHGLALVELDIASDSHELTVIPLGDVAKAKALAKKAGGGLISYAPKTPLKAPLAHAAPKAKAKVKVETLRLAWNVQYDDFVQLPGLLRWTGYGVGEMDERGKTYKVSTMETRLVDCRSWPPKESRLAQGRLSVAYSEADGSKVLHRVHYEYVKEEERFLPRPIGTLRVERPGKPPLDLLDKLPDNFDIKEVAWAGELVVLFPTEPTIRGKKSRRPLVWNGKTLTPAKGLPDLVAPKGTPKDRWPSFRRAGFARTGNGTDVIIWGGTAYIAKGDTFVKMCELARDLDPYATCVGAPAPGDGFFYVHTPAGKTPKSVIRRAEKGRCTEHAKLAYFTGERARVTPDGSVLIAMNRYAAPKAPALAVFHPLTNELTYVPPEMLVVRKDHALHAYGVAPKSSTGEAYLWGWVQYDDLLRRVPWSAILTLPRVPATP